MAENAVSEQEIANRIYIGPNKTGDNIDANRQAGYVWDSTKMAWARQMTDTITQAIYDAMVRLQPYQNAIPYARDINDQMRVVIGSGTVTNNTMAWGNVGSYPTYYGTGGPNSVDVREQLELQSKANFNQVRLGRWVIT